MLVYQCIKFIESESVLYPHDTQNAGEILLEQIKMLVYTTLGYRDPDSRDSEKNKGCAPQEHCL